MKKRSGISPVLATIILVAITLVIAIAVVGFVFGVFGQFQNPPQVSASASLSSQNGLSGGITLYNSGSSAATVVSISLTYNGQTCQASYTSSGSSVPASSSLYLAIQAGSFNPGSNFYNCGQTGTTSTAQPGMSYSGSVALAGGAQIPITGVFQ